MVKESVNVIFEEFSHNDIVWSEKLVIFQKKDVGLVLWIFIDDPDSRHRMMFGRISVK